MGTVRIGRTGWAAALLALTVTAAAGAAEPRPPLWGHGVKSCDDFARVWLGVEAGQEEAIAEYRRYQDWVAGFVTGLNLATGSDVLAGSDPEGALRRVHLYCDEHRKTEVLTALRLLVRELGTVD